MDLTHSCCRAFSSRSPFVPHHLSVVHDRTGGVAHGPRGSPSRDRRPAYRLVFEFWLKIFGVAFGLGVVSGIVMAFEFGTNWSELSRMSGADPGATPLSYEAFTAFALEAAFFGVLLFGRHSSPRGSTCFRPRWSRWGPRSRRSGSWSTTVGCRSRSVTVVQNGAFAPADWAKIIFSPVVWVRFPHMLIASYLTGAVCVAATGAWYLLRRTFQAEARIMLRMGLYLAAVLVPVQIFFGHLTGDYVFTTISRPSSLRSRGAGMTSSPPPKS